MLIDLFNFNSIKVQLEHRTSFLDIIKNKFQFHKGTIRTVEKKKKMTVISFQFHKGTIRTLYAQRMIANDANFNSIKVQLERHIPSWHRIDPQQISIP